MNTAAIHGNIRSKGRTTKRRPQAALERGGGAWPDATPKDSVGVELFRRPVLILSAAAAYLRQCSLVAAPRCYSGYLCANNRAV